MSADIDEKSIRKEKPEELVLALAEAKAEAIMQRIPDGENIEEDKSTLLITCDQVLSYI
jgi:septum formation protein